MRQQCSFLLVLLLVAGVLGKFGHKSGEITLTSSDLTRLKKFSGYANFGMEKNYYGDNVLTGGYDRDSCREALAKLEAAAKAANLYTHTSLYLSCRNPDPL